MVLWTIQSIGAWKKLQRCGVLCVDPRYADKDMRPAYEWMAAQMQKRLASKPANSFLPIWAWLQWEGERKRRPDLRCGGHLAKGSPGVLIEFEADETNVLLSDFDLWHYVLNYWYLPATEAEGKAFDAEMKKIGLDYFATKPLPNLKYHQRIEKSWMRIFDLSWSSEGISDQRKAKSIQAVLWELRKEKVRKAQTFISR